MPDIPILYDLETDDNYYYLIEQYLDGESLSARIACGGRLGAAELVPFGTALCRILDYLHSLHPPIYYTDLQPENILICGNSLKLIDFDSAVSGDSAAGAPVCGTPAFAAPELIRGARPSVRSDMYGLGAILCYMYTGTSPEQTDWEAFSGSTESRALRDLIRSCLSVKPEERPLTAAEVSRRLLQIGSLPEQRDQLYFRAAVCGSAGGTDTTGLCFRLAKSLGRQGILCLIREENQTGTMMKLADYLREIPDEHGLFHAFGCTVRPYYGNCVRLEDVPPDAAAEDYGTGLQAALRSSADVLILLCGSKPWQMTDTIRAIRKLSGEKNLRVVFQDCLQEPVLPGKLTRLSCFRMPSEENDAADDSFFTELLKGSRAGEKLEGRRQLSKEAGRDPERQRRNRKCDFWHCLIGRKRRDI